MSGEAGHTPSANLVFHNSAHTPSADLIFSLLPFGIYSAIPLFQFVAVAVRRATATNVAVHFGWAATVGKANTARLEWAKNSAINAQQVAVWGDPVALDVRCSLDWLAAALTDAFLGLPWSEVDSLSVSVAAAWQETQPGRVVFTPLGYLPTSQLFFHDASHRPVNSLLFRQIKRIGPTLALQAREIVSWGNPANLNSYKANDWDRARPNSVMSLSSWAAPVPTDNTSNLPWGDGQRLWPSITPVEWTSDTTPIDQNPAPPDPDIAEHYEMATDLTVKDVATGTALAVDGVAISLDIDSFAWKLSCRVLNSASMALCQPPALISVATMVYEWQFVVESYTRTRDMKMTWQLSASSQSRQLDAPWVAPASHLQTTPINFKQAVEACLPVGWAADWHASITDYTIPANAWSYSGKTNKAALADVLDAIGAVVVPDLSAKTLHIQPRYKLAPWEYDGVGINPDAIINQAMILSESGEYRPGQTVNGVWVSGSNDHGVIVEVKRAGTAGDQLAEDVYHDLITASTAGQQRGKQIIAAAGSKTLVTLETIITDEMASPGLVLPGMMVEVQSDDTWRGIVLSCDVKDPGAARITQTLTIERSHLA